MFEMLVLEGAQAGLSWETVLKKRDEYRRVFYQFDPVRVAEMSDGELDLVNNTVEFKGLSKVAKRNIPKEMIKFDLIYNINKQKI